MSSELRPATTVVVLLFVVAAGAGGAVVVTEADETRADTMTRTVPLGSDAGGQLWLYTSPRPSFEAATLPLNVVVFGDPTDVRRKLLESRRGDWNETDPDEQDVASEESLPVANATSIAWDEASGARRYVYFTDDERRFWFPESYQLHDGTYLGSRHHVRAYVGPEDSGQWTAMQAHHEHWDWFQARHVVTSIDESQSHLEREFVDGELGPEVTRRPIQTADGPVFDGWVTIVDYRGGGTIAALVPIVLLGAVGRRLVRRGRRYASGYRSGDVRAGVLAVATIALLLSVRLAGVELERALDVPPNWIAFVLYPVLFVGPPVLTYLLARPLDRPRAFSAASVGFLAAVLLDYSYLGVTHMPLGTLVHRGALAVALGLIAAGASRTEREDTSRVQHLRLGVLLWVGATVIPLLRFVPLPF